MEKYISKSALVAEIDRLQEATMDKNQNFLSSYHEGIFDGLSMLENFLDTLEVKEMDLIDRKTDWSPSKKQLESLKDLLHYNIGVFNYQKCMEVNSLYEDLTKILNYETDRQN